MVKHPACAAAMSSSGLVLPPGSPNRDAPVMGRSLIAPLLRDVGRDARAMLPDHWTCAVLCTAAIGSSSGNRFGLASVKADRDHPGRQPDPAIEQDLDLATTASATAGSARMEAGTPSRSLPPWLDTEMAVAPMPAARRASSGRMTPLTMHGPPHCPRTQPIFAHDGCGVSIHFPYAAKNAGDGSPGPAMFGTVRSGRPPSRSHASTQRGCTIVAQRQTPLAACYQRQVHRPR